MRGSRKKVPRRWRKYCVKKEKNTKGERSRRWKRDCVGGGWGVPEKEESSGKGKKSPEADDGLLRGK